MGTTHTYRKYTILLLTACPCWGAAPDRNFSLEDSLSSFFPKHNIPGWNIFLKIHLSLLSSRMVDPSQEPHFLPIQGFWVCRTKKKASHPKSYIPSLPAWCPLCPSYAFQKASGDSAVSSIILGWQAEAVTVHSPKSMRQLFPSVSAPTSKTG